MKKLLIFSGIIFLVSSLEAQNFYDFKGVGARAAGMAFAFNAVADDATAISWNPAGLTQLKKPEFSLIQRVQLEELEFTDLNDNTNTNTQEGSPYYTIDYLSFIYPLTVGENDLVLGISFQNQINYKFNQTSTYPNASHEGSSKGTTTVNSVSVSAAYPLSNFLSVGLAFNKYFSLGNNSEWSGTYRNPTNNAYYNMVEYYSFSGLNVTIGAFADLSSSGIPLKLAARINTPLKLKNEFSSLGDYHYEYPTDDYYRMQRKEGSETYHIPFILGTGISYRIGDYLTIAADYDIKPFKDAERTMEFDLYDDLQHWPPRDEFVDSTDLLVPSGDNLNQFRAGVEYILHPDFALIPVRLGWKNNPTNVAHLDINGQPEQQVMASSINAGFGLISKNFSVDFAYEYYNYTQDAENTSTTRHTLQSFIISLIVYIR
jgi:long-subunit fatty acid transport protein